MINDRIEYAAISTTCEWDHKAILQCRFVVIVRRPVRLWLWLRCGTPDVLAATATAAAAAATVHGLIRPIGNVLSQPKGELARHEKVVGATCLRS